MITEFIFKPGTRHSNADALSRLPLPDKPIPEDTILLMETFDISPTNTVYIARWTRRDSVLSLFYKFILNGWRGSWAKELEPYARRRYCRYTNDASSGERR